MIPLLVLPHSGVMNFIILKLYLPGIRAMHTSSPAGSAFTRTLMALSYDNTLGSYTHLHPVASEGMFRHFVGIMPEKRVMISCL